tara:strand:+ start:245 stop:382 length:138 start_codon:yes stop_codon:yes gene_type:complete
MPGRRDNDKRKTKGDKKRKKRYGVYKKGGKYRSTKVKEGSGKKKD